ncbi:MAG: hypothetical protein ABW032_05900 [Burkholderiaceae bacterium]
MGPNPVSVTEPTAQSSQELPPQASAEAPTSKPRKPTNAVLERLVDATSSGTHTSCAATSPQSSGFSMGGFFKFSRIETGFEGDERIPKEHLEAFNTHIKSVEFRGKGDLGRIPLPPGPNGEVRELGYARYIDKNRKQGWSVAGFSNIEDGKLTRLAVSYEFLNTVDLGSLTPARKNDITQALHINTPKRTTLSPAGIRVPTETYLSKNGVSHEELMRGGLAEDGPKLTMTLRLLAASNKLLHPETKSR